ncbi:MAG: serpin family protein [Candidatus Cloacimonetes bacterium]|nr:serpin family protein [Candidatus Cloacimonadota bacterium]
MKKTIVTFTLMLLLLSCTVTSSEQDSSYLEDTWQANRAEDIVTANSHFAFNVLQQLIDTEEPDNIVFSPLSLSLALGMTMNGAAATTLEQMKQTLHYGDLELEEINQQNLHLISNLLEFDPSIILGLANSIWIRNGYPVKEQFIALNEEYYLSEIFPDLPFNEQTIIDANAWVSDNTGGRIRDILKNLSEDDVVFLINAIYFAADWKYQFDSEETTEDYFYTGYNEPVQVPFMNCAGIDFTYLNGENFHAARLPYGNGDLAMYVFLPEYGADLQELISDQNFASFDSWFAGYEPVPPQMQESSSFSMPSFQVSCSQKYEDILSDLGMPLPFSQYSADFSNMVYEPAHPYIRYIKQNTWIRTDEQGSEATAATLVMMADGMPLESNIFVADRPFLYVIRDDRDGSILFIGIMNNPLIEE